MTTAHRPTFDPAKGKNTQSSGSILHTRALPAHTTLKFRQSGQGGVADADRARDLKAELLRKEENHEEKRVGEKRRYIKEEGEEGNGEVENESKKTKLQMLLEESGSENDDDDDDDGDGDGDGNDDDDDDNESESESDSDDELERELEKIKRERAEQRARDEARRTQREHEAREKEIAYGNPLLNEGSSRRKWNEDVVFRNQAKGLDDGKGKGFINDMIRSDFHRKFMDKYIR